MELFSAKQTFQASDEFVPIALRAIKKHFKRKGFNYTVRRDSYNVTSVEIQRGRLYEQALGMKKGTVIIFTRNGSSTAVEVRDCIIKNQLAGPAVLLYCLPQLRLPIAITEAFGMGMQANLPAEVMEVISEVYRRHVSNHTAFCPFCGTEMDKNERICHACGRSINTGAYCISN